MEPYLGVLLAGICLSVMVAASQSEVKAWYDKKTQEWKDRYAGHPDGSDDYVTTTESIPCQIPIVNKLPVECYNKSKAISAQDGLFAKFKKWIGLLLQCRYTDYSDMTDEGYRNLFSDLEYNWYDYMYDSEESSVECGLIEKAKKWLKKR